MSISDVNRKAYTVVLKLARISVPAKIEKARIYAAKITGNPHFLTPQPTPADILSAAQQLEAAYEASHDGSKTARRLLYNRISDLNFLLKKLGYYVQGIANETTIPDVVITSAGLDFRTSNGQEPRSFTVKNGKNKGTVRAVTTGQRASTGFVWEHRLKGASGWIQSAMTLKAQYLFTGLTSGSTYEFRYKVITRAGESDWRNSEELVIL